MLICQYLKIKEMSPRDLAKYLNCSASHINKIISGTRCPSKELKDKLLKLFSEQGFYEKVNLNPQAGETVYPICITKEQTTLILKTLNLLIDIFSDPTLPKNRE